MFTTLIIENDDISRQPLSRALTQRFPFMRIIETTHGEDELDHALAKHPDIIFMDIRPPGTNALYLTGLIKSALLDSVVCLIALHDIPGFRAAVIRSGADHFLVKNEATSAEAITIIESALAKRTKALIIEDSTSFRSMLGATIAARWPAMVVAEAGDGPEGMRNMAELKPDVILLDLRLPTTNGLHLIREIKMKQAKSAVIVVTSYDLPEYREAASGCGADHFISKGGKVSDEIVSAINLILSRKKHTAWGCSCFHTFPRF